MVRLIYGISLSQISEPPSYYHRTTIVLKSSKSSINRTNIVLNFFVGVQEPATFASKSIELNYNCYETTFYTIIDLYKLYSIFCICRRNKHKITRNGVQRRATFHYPHSYCYL